MPYRSPLLLLLVLSGVVLTSLSAKDKKPKPDSKDKIQVVGQIPLTAGAVKRFFTTQHYSSCYLYAEHENGVTLIDLTKASQPKVIAELGYGTAPDQELALVAGTAAMVVTERLTAAQTAPRSIKIMDFSDPANPKVAREFTGVTAMSRDERRGLIFIANVDGIWILQQHLVLDPEIEKAYANYVIYGMSTRPPE